MQHRYSRLALYNSWANRRLYDAAASLNDTDYRADRGAFFKSLHG
ncbi:MAG: damage-inducible protein DinB, partial [Hyphomicrobiales bacterium]|nr:damage-inducible protein DinB [Hyphomicrobiales bacterium]